MSYLVSTSSAYFTPEISGFNPAEPNSLADFNLPQDVNRLLDSFFALLTNIVAANRLELWFLQALPTDLAEAQTEQPRLKISNGMPPLDDDKLSRLAVPIKIGKVTYGLLVAYFLSENIAASTDTHKNSLQIMQLATTNLENGLAAMVKLHLLPSKSETEITPEVSQPGKVNTTSTLGGTDELTATLNLEFSRATRHNLNLAFMLIQIDTAVLQEELSNSANSSLFYLENDAKRADLANDTDKLIIQRIGSLTRKYLRVSDAVFQMDNSHLAVILPHTDELQAFRAAEKLVSYLESHSIFGSLNLPISRWLAIAISSFPYLSNNPESLIKHCQQALARFKRPAAASIKNRHNVTLKGNSAERPPIQIWKATKMLSSNEMAQIGDNQVVRAVMRGFQFVELQPYITQASDSKGRARLRNAFDKIPLELVRQHEVAAINLRKLTGSDALTVATADPSNTNLVTTLARITGCNIIAVAARSQQISQFIEIMQQN